MRSQGWLFLACLLFLAAPIAQAAEPVINPDFVGPESCKACHPAAYAAWRQSKHARALDSLSAAQQQDARCLSCHAPNTRERGVAHVTCETCHGGGQHYAAAFVMKDTELSRMVGLVDPSERACRSCHDASSPSLRPFDFVEKLKLIDHWSVERKQRAEAAKAAAEPPAKPEPKKKK